MNRIAIGKTVGLAFGLIGFITIPVILWDVDMMLRFAFLLWYITIWAIVWVFWVMDKHPVLNIRLPFWVRWPIVWAWLNFILVLFIYDIFTIIVEGTIMAWLSPYCLVVEWAIVWLIIDFIATKYAWEWKKLLK